MSVAASARRADRTTRRADASALGISVPTSPMRKSLCRKAHETAPRQNMAVVSPFPPCGRVSPPRCAPVAKRNSSSGISCRVTICHTSFRSRAPRSLPSTGSGSECTSVNCQISPAAPTSPSAHCRKRAAPPAVTSDQYTLDINARQTKMRPFLAPTPCPATTYNYFARILAEHYLTNFLPIPHPPARRR
jgi:hypothetical protein